MKDVIFRREKLIDREDETVFIKGWFNKFPKEILWIYGPKSSGKTTLIEYIVEKELFENFWNFIPKDNYWVRYINLRGYLITSYKTFLEAFIKPAKETARKEEKINARMSIGIFKINAGILNEVKQREKDLFNVLTSELQELGEKNKQPILIIDEIQTLEDIYINGERGLLKEFLNFCVRLTKELHICHVVILSSNTIFINQIYNDAKLKKTSSFLKIDHLEYEIIKTWLKEEGLSKKNIYLIWDYLGGCIPDIQKLFREWDKTFSLREYLDKKAFLAYTEMVNLLRKIEEPKRLIFRKICKVISDNGCFQISDKDNLELDDVINYFSEKEIFFFDPMNLKVNGNSRIYEKGMKLLLDN